MFNGIIFNKGIVNKIKKSTKGVNIFVKSNLKVRNKDLGVSICCDGVCLTLITIKKKIMEFYLSNETIMRSKFKYLEKNEQINLELPLKYGQKISGHFTQGHVDTTAKIKKINIIDNSWSIKLEIKNKKFMKFLEEKASISINGVSLTVSKVHKKDFPLIF